MTKIRKTQAGITLIALVITMIVMMILVGVTLNVLIGENGVVTQSQNAKKANDEAEEMELAKMAVAAARMNASLRINEEILEKNLINYFGKGNFEVSKIENFKTGMVDYEITLPSGRIYRTSSNVNILDIFVEETKQANNNGIYVAGYKIEIDEKIGLIYYFSIPDKMKDDVSKIKFFIDTDKGEEGIIYANEFMNEKVTIDKNKYYHATIYCDPKEMNDNITFCIYDENDNAISNEYIYSIKKYGNAVINNANNYIVEKPANQAKIEFVKALLYYGGMVQEYLGYNTDNLASYNVKVDTSYIDNINLDQYKAKLIDNNASEMHLFQSPFTILESESSLAIGLNVDETNKNEYRLLVDGKIYDEFGWSIKHSQYYIKIPVKLTEFDRMFEIYVIDKNNNKIGKGLEYGMYSYLEFFLTSDEDIEGFKDVAKSMIHLTKCRERVFK